MSFRLRKAPGSACRVRSAADTVELLRSIRHHFGITRIAEISGLDNLGIPIHSVFRPRSTSMSSVQSGKGITVADSLASGLAEAIETDCAERFSPADRIAGCYRDLRAAGHPVARFRSGLPGGRGIPDDLVLDWVWADDLLAAAGERHCRIPLELVAQGARRDGWRLFDIRVSNGLASGNVLEEAICHAIEELIERDAAGIFTFRTKYLEHDVRPSYRRIALGSLPSSGAALVARIRDSGRSVVLIDGTTDLGVAVVFCVIESHLGPCLGCGASLDAEVAVTRALTEAAQSSAGSIQGAREDLASRDPRIFDHSQGFDTFRGRQLIRDRAHAERPFAALPSRHNDYVDQDLSDLLELLRRHGTEHVYCCEIADPNLRDFAVARVVIPGLEDLRLDTIGARRLHHAL